MPLRRAAGRVRLRRADAGAAVAGAGPRRRPPPLPAPVRAARWASYSPGYEDYLRFLQNQVVASSPLLVESRERGKLQIPAPESAGGGGRGGVPAELAEEEQKAVLEQQEEIKFVTLNKLLSSPESPEDPMMLFRDIDNIRVLTQRAGSSLALKDNDCATLVIEMMNEVDQGRQLTRDVAKRFERMEAHPDFYKLGPKAYSVLIHKATAREYPDLEIPGQLFQHQLERGIVPTKWQYVMMSRIELFLQPQERPHFRDTMLKALDSEDCALTLAEQKTTRMFIENLRWITDLARLLLYAVGLYMTCTILYYAVMFRNSEREMRELMEDESLRILDEQYYGDAQLSDGGRQGMGGEVWRGGMSSEQMPVVGLGSDDLG